jgi:two-component system OmpR family sensor kinase
MSWRPNLRMRLTIASTILTGVVLLLAVLFARHQITSVYTDAAAQLAQSDLSPYVTDITKNPTETPDPPSLGVLALVIAPGGQRVVNTLPSDVADSIQGSADDGDHDGDHRITSGSAGDYVIASTTVDTTAGTWSLWAARDVSARDSALDQVDVAFSVGGGALLVLLAVGSWFLAGAALRPVESMRRRAENLGPDDTLPVSSNDELGRLATTLNSMVGRVRRSATRERQMVSDAAHELRTPLAGLRSRLELAQREIDDPELASIELELAQRSLERLSHLATNLLELARIDEGGPLAAHIATGRELERAALDVVDTARITSAERAIDIDHTIELDPDARVSLDPTSFSRIVENLLSNAINAVDRDGQITLELRSEVGRVVLVVQDDGPGAPADFLPRAFERFARPDDARTVSGSGIGLALVDALVRSADGSAQVENTAPGFRATVILPTA